MTVDELSQSPHFGLILALTVHGLAIGEYPELVKVSKTAEDGGFDSVWLCDHFLTLSEQDYAHEAGIAGGPASSKTSSSPATMPLLEGWTALAALARDTSRIRLGTSVLCNSYRYPSVLAKMAATLDVISEGRLELGLGAGWFKREFDAYGIPFPPAAARVSALGESLDVIRAIWTQDNPTFTGHTYAVSGAICNPPPVQRPHPPLWVGGEGDRVHRIAAGRAHGINVRWWSPHKIRSRQDFLRRACAAAERDPATLALSVTTLLAPTTSARQTAQVRAEFASIPDTGFIVGSPQQCIDRLQEYRESGVDTFLFTIPHVAKTDYLHVVSEQIFPVVRSIN